MINKIIAILILVFIIILFVIYYHYHFSDNNDNNIEQIYVINLKKRPKRLYTFRKYYKLNRHIIVYDAIDGN